MKKTFYLIALLATGLVSANSGEGEIEIENANNNTKSTPQSECNSQTTQDMDGDEITVTCCRTTYEEAYNCAAKKLKKMALD